jgi:hypothetical protein
VLLLPAVPPLPLPALPLLAVLPLPLPPVPLLPPALLLKQ